MGNLSLLKTLQKYLNRSSSINLLSNIGLNSYKNVVVVVVVVVFDNFVVVRHQLLAIKCY